MSAMEATAGSVPAQAGPEAKRLGLFVFIGSEAVLFANLIAAYLYLRVRTGVWPPEGMPHLELGFATVNTLILILSGLPMQLAHSGIQKGNERRLVMGLIGTIVLGAIFISGQAWEYVHAGFTPQSGVYGSTFFTLTGFHGAHVMVGLTLLTVSLVRALRGRFTVERHFGIEATALYWHFVDVVWVFLFAVLYLL